MINLEKVKVRKVKSPLKKYKKIIDEVQYDRDKMPEATYGRLVEIGRISQLISDNKLNHDLLCEVMGVGEQTYVDFFLDLVDEPIYKYMVKEFCALFRIPIYHLNYKYYNYVTFVPKWCNNYRKMRLYLKYNKIILWYNNLWLGELSDYSEQEKIKQRRTETTEKNP